MFLNFALNFFNKWAFTKVEDGGAGFSFPIFYTMWNTLASFCGTNLLMLLVPVNRTISWKQFVDNKFALLVFGVVFSSNIVTNNASLVYISLSVNQVIKCLVPIPAIIFSYFIEKKTYSYPGLDGADRRRMHEHTVGRPQGHVRRLLPRAVVHGHVGPAASAHRPPAQKQQRERPHPGAPAVVRRRVLHDLPVLCIFGLRGDRHR